MLCDTRDAKRVVLGPNSNGKHIVLNVQLRPVGRINIRKIGSWSCASHGACIRSLGTYACHALVRVYRDALGTLEGNISYRVA